jgi:hypothetical protein
MKKSLVRFAISLTLISSMYIPCRAQKPALDPIQLGLKAGLNISSLYTTDSSVADVIFGFHAGASLKCAVSSIIDIQPELYASTKGATIRYNSALLNGMANFRLTYLELPLLCQIKVSKHLNIQVGPYVSYLIDAKVKNMGDVQLFNFEQNVDVNNFNRLDTGFAIGASIVVHAVTVGIRYNYGFVKVGKEETLFGNTYTIPNTTNDVVGFYMSVPVFTGSRDPFQ